MTIWQSVLPQIRGWVLRRRFFKAVALMALALGRATMVPAAAEAPSDLPPPINPTLWTPEQKIVGFRNIAKIYGGDVIHHGAVVMPLPRATHELKVHYQVRGAAQNTTKFMDHNYVAGLIVLHRGRIVLERYGLGQTEHDQWVSFSVAKSVMSTLLGAAIRDGMIHGLDDPVTHYIPEFGVCRGDAAASAHNGCRVAVGRRLQESHLRLRTLAVTGRTGRNASGSGHYRVHGAAAPFRHAGHHISL